MWTDTFEYKKYLAQMLKVAGDFRRVLGAFENPDYWHCNVVNYFSFSYFAYITYGRWLVLV